MTIILKGVQTSQRIRWESICLQTWWIGISNTGHRSYSMLGFRLPDPIFETMWCHFGACLFKLSPAPYIQGNSWLLQSGWQCLRFAKAFIGRTFDKLQESRTYRRVKLQRVPSVLAVVAVGTERTTARGKCRPKHQGVPGQRLSLCKGLSARCPRTAGQRCPLQSAAVFQVGTVCHRVLSMRVASEWRNFGNCGEPLSLEAGRLRQSS